MPLLRPAPTALALALTMIAPAAWAQAPPAGYAPPPAGYAPPPAGYAPPPAYTLPPSYSYPPAYGPPVLGPMGPAILPYKDGSPIPDGYHPEMRFRSGLIIGGAITFGVTYSLAVATASLSGEGVLAVPIAGPFLQLGRINFASSTADSPSFSGAVATVLVFDGVAQIAGAAMLIVGLTRKKQVLVREDVAGSTVRVTPLGMGYGGIGIGIVGTM